MYYLINTLEPLIVVLVALVCVSILEKVFDILWLFFHWDCRDCCDGEAETYDFQITNTEQPVPPYGPISGIGDLPVLDSEFKKERKPNV